MREGFNSRPHSVTGLKPAVVSTTAFWIAALRLFLQSVSLAANFSLRRIKNLSALLIGLIGAVLSEYTADFAASEVSEREYGYPRFCGAFPRHSKIYEKTLDNIYYAAYNISQQEVLEWMFS